MEAASKIEDQDKAATALVKAERDALSSLARIKEKYTVKRPTGVALPKTLSRDWDGYRLELKRLETDVFSPCENEIANSLGEVARHARLYIDQRKRLEQRIKSLASERKKQLEDAVSMTRSSASDTRKTVFDVTQKAMAALDLKIKQIQVDLNSTNLESLTQENIETMRKDWENELEFIETHHRDALMKARDMLAALAESLKTSDGIAPAEAMEALEDRMLSLEEEADQNFEMVQLGLAVAIINHEFASAIKNVRNSVRELGKVSKNAPPLRQLYTSIRQNFEHLDGHLKLFTPLQRRLYRETQDIKGTSIRNYVNDLFGVRIQRHNITVDCTDDFLDSTVKCFPSTLYPAIINLVDNAIFWLDSKRESRKILLDVSGVNIVVANTGPKIEDRDSQAIFKRGFSRKPGGRGLGLFISARALQDEGMGLLVATPPPNFSVAFHISAPTLCLKSND